MILFGHIGITAGVAQAYNVIAKKKLDVRLAMVFAIVPDLIDKPVGLLYKNLFRNHTRLFGHSLLFSVTLLAALLLFGRKLRYPTALWLCALGHLLFDKIWDKNAHAMLWPFLGKPESLEPLPLVRWFHAIFMPYSVFGEVTGLVILIYLFFKYRLYFQDNMFRFLSKGNLT